MTAVVLRRGRTQRGHRRRARRRAAQRGRLPARRGRWCSRCCCATAIPGFELLACSVLLLLYYTFDRRDISPAPLLSRPALRRGGGGLPRRGHRDPGRLHDDRPVRGGHLHPLGPGHADRNFLPSIVVLALAITLGEVVRSRRALAAETAERLRVAHEEREAEAGQAGGRGAAADRQGPARHGGAQHGHDHGPGGLGAARARGPGRETPRRAHRDPGDQQARAPRDARHAGPAAPGHPGWRHPG